MPYRLYRRESITKGEWYLAVICKGCGLPNYLLDDPSKGKNDTIITGDGQISTSCIRCTHDDLYPAVDLKPIQATETIQGPRPPRVPTSNSSRKPILQNKSSAAVTFGVGYLEDRPKAAAIIGRIITSWADVEVQSARLLAELMGTNIPAAAAVFGSLRSGRAQHDALHAAARTVLDGKDYELFTAYMARRNALEGERNDLTHGCFGVSPSIPDDIVWVSQTDYLDFNAAYQHDNSAHAKFRAKQAIYELGTLERIAQEIAEFYDQIASFTGYLWARRGNNTEVAFRIQRYAQLCSQPHIRQALERIRTTKKASEAQPQGKRAKTKR